MQRGFADRAAFVRAAVQSQMYHMADDRRADNSQTETAFYEPGLRVRGASWFAAISPTRAGEGFQIDFSCLSRRMVRVQRAGFVICACDARLKHAGKSTVLHSCKQRERTSDARSRVRLRKTLRNRGARRRKLP